MKLYSPLLLIVLAVISCSRPTRQNTALYADSVTRVTPTLVSDPVAHDSDDPAFWLNPQDPAASLILGTDKGGDTGDGGLFVFDLQGRELKNKTVTGIKRPNNVDVAYGLMIQGKKTDIAVCTERNTNSLRIFSLPDMRAIDNGGIPVFDGDSLRAPMGVALYTGPAGDIYAIVSRKKGASGSYLWQYKLEGNAGGTVSATLVRTFGNFSGKNEIEAVAVDNELGYVYCSDESVGIRKYYAHPDSSTTELAFFGTSGFADNHEGISIYKTGATTGYILVSDQQANLFRVFSREGAADNAHQHNLLQIIPTSTLSSDGSDVTSVSLPGFPKGLFVAMSDDKTFQYYAWEKLGVK